MTEAIITSVLPDGRRVATDNDGSRIAVRGRLVPGDRIQYSGVPHRKKLVEAKRWELLEPASNRRDAPCPLSGQCGGCDFDVLTESDQRAQRAKLVNDRLRHLGLEVVTHHAPEPWIAYRARIKLQIDSRQLGYHAPGSNRLVPVDRCGIARPEVQAAQGQLSRWLAEFECPFTAVEIRSDGNRVMYHFQGKGFPSANIRQNLAKLGHVAVNSEAVSGDPVLWLKTAGLTLRASPDAFYQVHLEANAILVDLVCRAASDVNPERIVDLYCGIGNLTLPLAQATKAPVLGVERVGQATKDLEFNAQNNGLSDRIQVVTKPVERWDPSTEPFDVVVLDPPRVGAKGVLDTLLMQRPRRIIYVSCHLPSAIRDIRPVLRAGYQLTAGHSVDLFPETHHVESVLVMDRNAT